MGVMLRPDEDPMPNENELARLAGLVPGDIDRKHLEELRRNLDEKAFRWAMNQNPMATEKLAEGIRLFAKDLGELRKIVAKRFVA